MILSDSDVLYIDDDIIVVNKPVDLPVHKNEFLPADADYLTKLVGFYTGKPVFPAHRLDAKTSGVIVLAFSREAAGLLTKQFEHHEVEKTYLLVVKGNPEDGRFDNPVVIKKKKKRVAALTDYRTLRTVKTHINYRGIVGVELSMVEATPKTGKWHQLRQHFAFNRTDIIGDTQHGDWTLNRIVTELTNYKKLFLHAQSLKFTHPVSKELVEVKTEQPQEYNDVLNCLEGYEYVAVEENKKGAE